MMPTSAPEVCEPAIETNLTVQDPVTSLWVKEITVNLGDSIKITGNPWFHNNGTSCNLTNISGMISLPGDTFIINLPELAPGETGPPGSIIILSGKPKECGTNIFRFNVTAECEDTGEIVTDEDTVTVNVICPTLEVNKTVWNGTDWVKVLNVSTNDIMRFNCTITNLGPSSVSDIRFWDILDCSLNYSGNATLKNESDIVKDVSLTGNFVFKPLVLHPDNLSWNPYNPKEENFSELCPAEGRRWKISNVEDDNDGNGRLSNCDQICMYELIDGQLPDDFYHVVNVPYTLNVTNIESNESMYIDSVLTGAASVTDGEFSEDITLTEGLDTGVWIVVILSPGRDGCYETGETAGCLTLASLGITPGKSQTQIVNMIYDFLTLSAGSDDLVWIGQCNHKNSWINSPYFRLRPHS